MTQVYGRDASFGTIKPEVSPLAAATDNVDASTPGDDKDDVTIKVDKVLTKNEFNVWNLPAKAKVLLVSNIPTDVANPRFVSIYLFRPNNHQDFLVFINAIREIGWPLTTLFTKKTCNHLYVNVICKEIINQQLLYFIQMVYTSYLRGKCQTNINTLLLLLFDVNLSFFKFFFSKIIDLPFGPTVYVI